LNNKENKNKKMKYEEMLKKGMGNLPEINKNKERFEVPKAKGHVQGNTTVINNFHQIVTDMGREKEHLTKYLLKELATPGDMTKTALILRRKVSSGNVNEKIKKYAETYVLCQDCGKPDTKMVKESGMVFIRCMACGSKNRASK
jgi:translation initiation factor 2 subunit 2